MAVVDLARRGCRRSAGIDDRLSMAVSNSPRSTVLSGDPGALREVLDRLQGRDIFCAPGEGGRRLAQPADRPPPRGAAPAPSTGFTPSRRPCRCTPPSSGAWETTSSLDGDYWCRNLRQPVLFSTAVEKLLADGHGVFLELSPHPILLPAVEGMLHHLQREAVVLPSMEREKPEREVALASLGALHTLGVGVNWSYLYPEGRCVRLPTYPWQRKRYWRESGKPSLSAETPARGHPILGRALGALAPLPGSRLWERTWSAGAADGLDRLLGVPVFSAATLVNMARAAAAEAFGPGEHVVEDAALDGVFAVSEGAPWVLQTVLTPAVQGSSAASLQVFVGSAGGGEPAWTPAGRATVRRVEEATATRVAELGDIQGRCTTDVTPQAHLAGLRERGLGGGEAGRRLEELRGTRGEALARMAAAPEGEAAAGSSAPLSLQECFEILHAAAPDRGLAPGVAFLPTAVERFRGVTTLGEAGWVHAVVREGRPGELAGDVRLLSAAGQVLAEALGVRLEPAESPSLAQAVVKRVAGLRYEIVWREQVAAAPAPRTPAGASWVLLADRGGVARTLARLLRERGDRCILAFAGAPPEANGDLGVDPSDAAEMGRLLSRVEPAGRGGVVHLWGLDTPPCPSDGVPLGEAPVSGCLSALHAAQALACLGSEPRRLWLVTRGAEPVTDAPGLAVSQAPIWGFGRVLALEQPANWGGLVDLDPAAPEDEARALLAEIDDGGGEDQVGFRGGRRHVARLARPTARPAAAAVHWRRDGSYLITGGLGGLGLQVARWMASRGAGHIVLTSRSGLPARTEWERESQETKAGKQIEAVRGLEALGTVVSIVRADAGDEAAMGTLFESFGTTRPPLRGIVHAAGILTNESVASLRPETFRAVLQPKVEGAWTLHRRSASQPLDFFVLFSSGASIWGSKGFAHYAAANHFLDGLAHHRAALGLPALSVNWGWWAGGGITGEDSERFFRQIGLEMIPSGLALPSLEALLGEVAVQNTVADVNWSVFKPIYESRGRRPFLAEIDAGPAVEAGTADSRSDLLERLQAARPADRHDALAAHVASAVATILGFDSPAAIERRLGFFKMGMDSIMTVQLRSRLERSLGRKLPPTVAFEYPTVETLASFLDNQMFSEAPSTAPTRGEPTEAEDLSEDELTILLAERLRQSR